MQKSIYKLLTFLESYRIQNVDSEEVSLNGNVYDFSVDYVSVDKSNILNILNKYLMTNKNKNNV